MFPKQPSGQAQKHFPPYTCTITPREVLDSVLVCFSADFSCTSSGRNMFGLVYRLLKGWPHYLRSESWLTPAAPEHARRCPSLQIKNVRIRYRTPANAEMTVWTDCRSESFKMATNSSGPCAYRGSAKRNTWSISPPSSTISRSMTWCGPCPVHPACPSVVCHQPDWLRNSLRALTTNSRWQFKYN